MFVFLSHTLSLTQDILEFQQSQCQSQLGYYKVVYDGHTLIFVVMVNHKVQ